MICTFEPARENHCQIWDDFQQQGNVHGIVAVLDGCIVGYGSIVLEIKIRGGKMGHIEDIVAHPRHRNSGIGKLVVDSLFEIARANGCYKVALQCKSENVGFYLKNGLSVSGAAMQRLGC